MSLVVAVRSKTECWIGYDAAAGDTDAVFESVTPKAVKHSGGGIVGAVGSWGLINILHGLKNTECEPQTIAAVIESIKEGSNSKSLKGAEVLMVWPGRPILSVTDEAAIIEMKSNFMAIGAGKEYAMGYLEGCQEIGATEISRAIEVAAKYSTTVMKPVRVVHYAKATKENQ